MRWHAAGSPLPFQHRYSVKLPLLDALLRSHPNQPLVSSVLDGLRNGFWPGYEGTAAQLSASTVLAVFDRRQVSAKLLSSHKLKNVVLDNSKEFVNKDFNDYSYKHGVFHDWIAPYTPERKTSSRALKTARSLSSSRH